jgi:hypothetical protein
MTIRSDITIDWATSPREIRVDAASTELTAQDLYDTCQARAADLIRLEEPVLASAAGKEALGGGVSVGITVTLQDAQVRFLVLEGGSPQPCQLSGGNVVAVDGDGGELNPVYGPYITASRSSAATLQELSAIQYSSFDGAVTFDGGSVHSGTAFPVGTIEAPVNNLVDAQLIATERGFNTYRILGQLAIVTGDFANSTFEGQGTGLTGIVISPNANVVNCTFRYATVTGRLDGESRLEFCRVYDLEYVAGVVYQTMLDGTVTLGGGATAHFLYCTSGIPGTATPTIDLGGSGQALAMRAYAGGIRLANKSGSEAVSIDLLSGQVKLSADVTAGDIVLRGTGTLSEDLSSANVMDQLVSAGGLSAAQAQALADALKLDEFMALK